MLETATEIATTTTVLVIGWMLITAPGWVTGKIVARKNRALPVPVFLKPRIIRWLLWALLGLVSLVGFYFLVHPSGVIGATGHVVAAMVLVVSIAMAMLVSFYIGWTASARRRARKSVVAPDNLPYVFGGPAEEAGAGSHVGAPDDADEYRPARPSES